MGPQTFALIQGALVFIAGLLASRGLLSQETVTWLGTPDTLALITTLGGAAVIGIAWWKTRPPAIVHAAGKALEGKGVIVAPPSIADSKGSPDNVVSSLADAAKVPGVATH